IEGPGWTMRGKVPAKRPWHGCCLSAYFDENNQLEPAWLFLAADNSAPWLATLSPLSSAARRSTTMESGDDRRSETGSEAKPRLSEAAPAEAKRGAPATPADRAAAADQHAAVAITEVPPPHRGT